MFSIKKLISNTSDALPAYPRRHLLAAFALAATVTLASAMWPNADHEVSANVPAVALDAVIGPAVSDPVPALAVPDAPSLEPVAEPEPAWREFRVRSGDSLALIFKREKLRAADLQAVLDGGPETKRLRRIHPGEVLQYSIDDDGRLLALRYEFSALEAMEARRDDAEAPFTAVLVQREPEHRIAYSQGVIDSSLFLACTRAGLDDGTAMKLADIFQWDIDFVLEIRQGDSFDLVFEELWLDGKKIGNGAILAAEFVNQGERYRAVRYTDTSGYTSYYTPEGMSMRKAFLRAPVDFSRISSNFNPRRLHPVWKTVRPHRGIDYAAPSGTPVKAAGDGKVVTVTSNGPSGNFVVLQHGESYQTKYLHLSRFARGMKRNKRVSQGDIIGYVGATGWATAPHLHYEFLVHGVHQNPRTVDLPKALPIADAERTRFMSSTRETVARLDALRDDEQIALAAGQATNGG